MSRLRVGLAILIGSSLAAVAGCGHVKESPGAPSSGSSAVHNIAQSSQWANEGKRLRAFKASQHAKAGNAAASVGPSSSIPPNAGDWAYQSRPVDITGNGNYTLDYGPVDNGFDFPENPSTVVFDFPSDMKLVITPFGRRESPRSMDIATSISRSRCRNLGPHIAS